MKTKIVIVVDGGVVQEVFSNSSEVEVKLVDYDNQPASTREKEVQFHEILAEYPQALSF